MRTSELQGAALDWAVAKAEGIEHYFDDGSVCLVGQPFDTGWRYWTPSSDWSQGGPIIARENISMLYRVGVRVIANIDGKHEQTVACRHPGDIQLIAAMRCYVASKMGDEVEVPEELLQGEQA